MPIASLRVPRKRWCRTHLLECTHADMKKQHIARHDAMMRMLIKGFTKGTKGSHYLIADVGTSDTLKDIGVHSKRVPKFVLPDSHIQHTTQDLQPCKNNLTCRVGSARNKMRPDMMMQTQSNTPIYHVTQTPAPHCQTCQPPCPVAEQGESLWWKEATAVTSRIWRRSGKRGNNMHMPSWRKH